MKSITLIILGSLSTAFGIKGFLVSSHFIDGGVTGISMLLNNIFGFPVWILLCLLNLPFIIFGHRQLGKTFVIKSIFSILVLSIAIAVIPFPDVTPDKLLTALFGGFFIGAGIGLAMRGGAVLDGSEIVALLVSKNTPAIKVADVILIMNILIFSAAVFILGVEPALYSIVTYFTAAKMIDFVINGIEEYIGVTIISENNKEIKQMIINELGRGVTIYIGKRGFTKQTDDKQEIEIIYSAMTRLEIGRLQIEVDRLDPNAFIIYQSINDIKGGIIKKRALH